MQGSPTFRNNGNPFGQSVASSIAGTTSSMFHVSFRDCRFVGQVHAAAYATNAQVSGTSHVENGVKFERSLCYKKLLGKA